MKCARRDFQDASRRFLLEDPPKPEKGILVSSPNTHPTGKPSLIHSKEEAFE